MPTSFSRSLREGYSTTRWSVCRPQCTRRSNPDLAFHWRELYHEISNGHELTPARLAMIAANYGLPMNAWLAAESLALIDDPLPVGEVRYSHLARQETLPLVLKFAERLALSSH